MLRGSTPLTGVALVLAASVAITISAQGAGPQLPFYGFAPTSPMGWNSYGAFGDTVTEAEVMANAKYVKEKLLPHGWNWTHLHPFQSRRRRPA